MSSIEKFYSFLGRIFLSNIRGDEYEEHLKTVECISRWFVVIISLTFTFLLVLFLWVLWTHFFWTPKVSNGGDLINSLMLSISEMGIFYLILTLLIVFLGYVLCFGFLSVIISIYNYLRKIHNILDVKKDH